MLKYNQVTKLGRIILALDEKPDNIYGIVEELSELISCFKVGLSLISSGQFEDILDVVKKRGREVFYDGKFHDIPNTVAGAVSQLVGRNISLFTVHAAGGAEMLRAANDSAKEVAAKLGVTPPIPVAVTILTSIDDVTFHALFDTKVSIMDEVLRLIEISLKADVTTIVASPLEVNSIRKRFGSDVVIMTPGIRPTWSVKGDQKRVATPTDVIKAGSDYLVVGRPILFPPAEIGSRYEATIRIINEIKE